MPRVIQGAEPEGPRVTLRWRSGTQVLGAEKGVRVIDQDAETITVQVAGRLEPTRVELAKVEVFVRG